VMSWTGSGKRRNSILTKVEDWDGEGLGHQQLCYQRVKPTEEGQSGRW